MLRKFLSAECMGTRSAAAVIFSIYIMSTPCGTRTRNLRIRSPTPCPLGQGTLMCIFRIYDLSFKAQPVRLDQKIGNWIQLQTGVRVKWRLMQWRVQFSEALIAKLVWPNG